MGSSLPPSGTSSIGDPRESDAAVLKEFLDRVLTTDPDLDELVTRDEAGEYGASGHGDLTAELTRRLISHVNGDEDPVFEAFGICYRGQEYVPEASLVYGTILDPMLTAFAWSDGAPTLYVNMPDHLRRAYEDLGLHRCPDTQGREPTIHDIVTNFADWD